MLLAICIPHCVQGTCVSPDTCICHNGWTGLNCDTGNETIRFISYQFDVTAICTSPCIQGTCVSPDTCECNNGWTGSVCDSGELQYPC